MHRHVLLLRSVTCRCEDAAVRFIRQMHYVLLCHLHCGKAVDESPWLLSKPSGRISIITSPGMVLEHYMGSAGAEENISDASLYVEMAIQLIDSYVLESRVNRGSNSYIIIRK